MPNTREARPTQEFVEIDRVQGGVIFLKNGALRRILLVAGVNFDLKSEEEQRVIIAAYQNLLNSLKFSLQFFVHSRRINIESYLARLEERSPLETNELLRSQITEYVSFIKSFVGQNPIMTKNFFVVVPFDPIILPPMNASFFSRLFGFGGQSAIAADAETKKRRDDDNVDQLAQRVSQVIAGLAEIGLRAVPLGNEEVVELFYNLYNPESQERKVAATESGTFNKPLFNTGSLNQQANLEIKKE